MDTRIVLDAVHLWAGSPRATSSAVLEDAGTGQVVALGVLVTLAAAAVGLALSRLLRRLLRRWGVTGVRGTTGRSPTVTICVLGALVAYDRALGRPWADVVAQVLSIALTASIAWLFVAVATAVEQAALARLPESLEDLRARHVRTQITLLRRIAVALVVLVAVAAVLWSIPGVRELGVSLLASAGVLGIVAGLAAQTTLGNVFAGMQIAFTDAIRVGDVVVIDDEWGHIEVVTLTYVAVRVWDGTTLILPCTYFTSTPFKNWTHAGSRVVGQLDLHVDWAADVDDLRGELDRLVRRSAHWDGSVARLVVEATSESSITLRCFVSADRSDDVADLLREVREGLVVHVQRGLGTVPRRRHLVEVGHAPRGEPVPAESRGST